MSDPTKAAPASAPVSGGGAETARIVLTLTIAGLLSGFAIVASYRTTLPAIHAHQAEALRRAVFEVLPGTTSMTRLVWDGGALTEVADGQASDAASIFAGHRDDGSLVGYAIPAAGAGFQDTIKLLYGLEASGTQVVGMTILESRETPGLGDRIYKDQRFVDEFRALVVDPVIALVKGHGAAPNEVDAITGATISSKAVVRILNEGNALWRPRLPAADQQPPASATDTTTPDPGPDWDQGGPIPGGRAGDP